jgi:hypothetical protein
MSLGPGSGSGGSGQNRHFPKLKQWVDQYAPPGVEDSRSVVVFMDCENRESQESLRSELRAISSGHYRGETLDRIVGRGRANKHGSYEAWAKLMLLWMANYKG